MIEVVPLTLLNEKCWFISSLELVMLFLLSVRLTSTFPVTSVTSAKSEEVYPETLNFVPVAFTLRELRLLGLQFGYYQ
jgi:hypothetical protein